MNLPGAPLGAGTEHHRVSRSGGATEYPRGDPEAEALRARVASLEAALAAEQERRHQLVVDVRRWADAATSTNRGLRMTLGPGGKPIVQTCRAAVAAAAAMADASSAFLDRDAARLGALLALALDEDLQTA